MDVTGMLDTARYIVWADISAKTPTLEEDAEIVLLRKARGGRERWADGPLFRLREEEGVGQSTQRQGKGTSASATLLCICLDLR